MTPTRGTLHVIQRSFPGDPALDAAVSSAVLERVSAGELPETLRFARSEPAIAFAKRDAIAPGYAAAARAARDRGFDAALRLAGGRAAAYHEGTLELAHAVPDPDPRAGIHERYRDTSAMLARALARLGADARVGEIPGEYCPGGYSVNAGGRVKLAGTGQRVVKAAAHVGTVVVAHGEERIRDVLLPVYAALGLGWDPATAGSVGMPVERVEEAVLAELATSYSLVSADLDDATMTLARERRADHRVGAGDFGEP